MAPVGVQKTPVSPRQSASSTCRFLPCRAPLSRRGGAALPRRKVEKAMSEGTRFFAEFSKNPTVERYTL
jgi:hypothetical protein